METFGEQAENNPEKSPVEKLMEVTTEILEEEERNLEEKIKISKGALTASGLSFIASSGLMVGGMIAESLGVKIPPELKWAAPTTVLSVMAMSAALVSSIRYGDRLEKAKRRLGILK